MGVGAALAVGGAGLSFAATGGAAGAGVTTTTAGWLLLPGDNAEPLSLELPEAKCVFTFLAIPSSIALECESFSSG